MTSTRLSLLSFAIAFAFVLAPYEHLVCTAIADDAAQVTTPAPDENAVAQAEKPDEPKKEEPPKEEPPKEEPPKEEPPKEEPPQPAAIFPDKALEEAVRAVVFEKRFNQEPITKEDVANIPHVIGRGKGIKSLEGLQHCKALMKIDLENNQISDLTPIADLTRLISVSFAGNQIQDLKPLEKLTAVQLLDLSRNQVQTLDSLKGMSNLRDLWIADNQISDLSPITDLTKIWYLDIAGNQVVNLEPVAKLGWLTTLDISGNQIESLQPITGLRELDMLLMSRNKVSDLTPLVDMCRKDAEGDRRFAPYLEVYLGENPIDEKKKSEQTAELQSFGVDVYDK